MNNDKFWKYLNNERLLLFFGVLIISIVFLPYLYWGESTPVRVHDNLDSNIVWVKILKDANALFAPPNDVVESVMDGLPRSSLHASYDISLLPFGLLDMFWGYVLNKYLMAIIGFVGMYLLLKRYFLKEEIPLYIPICVAILFALLPFWSFSASVSGLPLVFYALLNIRNKKRATSDWLILLLYGFYSSLVLTGFFVLLLFSFILIFDFFRKKKINWYLFGGIFFLSFIYVLSNIPLFLSFWIDSDYHSHRLVFKYQDLLSAKETLTFIIDTIFKETGAHHVVSCQYYILILAVFVLFLMIKRRQVDRNFIIILMFIFISSLLCGIYEWSAFADLRTILIQKFPLNLSRINWLHPMCWYILFGISLSYIYKSVKKWGNIIVCCILIVQSGIVLNNVEYRQTFLQSGFSGFFAEDQFKDIRSYIGKDVSAYRVISIGIHPSIAQYNGFWTLDGYFANYPLEYKHKFYNVIEPEISKDKELNDYFVNWGSRCYAFSSELGRNLSLDNRSEIEHLDYNFDKLKEMNGQYIISAIKINETNNQRLKLLKVFNNYTSSNWTIYLYKVI